MIVNTFFGKIKDISQDELEKDIKYFVSICTYNSPAIDQIFESKLDPKQFD